MSDPLQINRDGSSRVELLTADEAPIGTLAGVRSGSVSHTSATSVHGSAQLAVADVGQAVNWLSDRIKPIVTIDGYGDVALGVFLATEAPPQWADTGRVWSVKFKDKTTILDQDAVAETYTLDAGAVVTDEIETLIESTGETNHAITPSTAVLLNPLAWPPGTTKLQIVNDLLTVINYFSLFCNGDGQYRGEPYVKPASRPVVWEFLDGPTCVYLPAFTQDVDLYAIPNRVIAITQGDGETAALVGDESNTDPASPYSTVSRGRTITRVFSGVEIVDQPTLDAWTLRRLIELTTPTASVEIAHAVIPDVLFNRAVTFRRIPAGINARHVVSKTEVSLDPTQLAKSTLTEVVDL